MSRKRAAKAASPAPASSPALATGHGSVETSLVLIFPVLLAYSIGVLFVGHVNGADVITRSLYSALGRTPYLLVYAVVSIVYLMWVRKAGRTATLRLEVVAPVILEAAIYAFTLGAAITLIVHHLLGLGIDGSSLVSALGAGVHEELVFRLGLFTALVAVLRDARKWAVVLALVISSEVFAAAHHIGAHGEPFTMHAFVFRSFAGAAFACIFWFRSLSHAVYAHVLYDLVVAAS
jgi:hypothetical protein